jgi:hypothetical protein
MGAIVGTCTAGFGYAKNSSGTPDSTTAPRYECRAENNTRNIDQFRFEKVGGEVCVKYCSVTDGNIFGTTNVYRGPTLSYVTVGNKISLRCVAGNGQAISGSARNQKTAESVLDACGAIPWDSWGWTGYSITSLISTDRIPTLPSITCTNDGWSTVLNPCSACRNCASEFGQPNYDNRLYVTYYGDKPRANFYYSEFGASNTLGHLENNPIVCRYFAESGYGIWTYFIHARLARQCIDGVVNYAWYEWGGGACNGISREYSSDSDRGGYNWGECIGACD